MNYCLARKFIMAPEKTEVLLRLFAFTPRQQTLLQSFPPPKGL